MQKITRLLFMSAILVLGIRLSAQTTILDETLLTQQSFNMFTRVSVSGAQEWSFSPQYGAVCSGYFNSQSNANEDWLISPEMNFLQMDDVTLTFNHTRGPGAMVSVGVAEGWYKAFATANYTGNPSTTSWVELSGLNQGITDGWQYIASGNLEIPSVAKSAHSRIAFRYISNAAQSATWEIKNVKVTAVPQGTVSFRITNWNAEWLGCTQFGPDNESLQLSNVASAMLLMDSDVYCLQEISNTPSMPTIASLVAQMGSTQWGGAIVPSNTGDCNQRQAIIYKKARVQLVSSSELNNGNPAQGNTYYYNWTSGRFPAVHNINLLSGNTVIPVSLINIHAKAEDGNASSYIRRKGGSEGLKGILDSPTYNSKNVIILGDFNDYLIGTSSDVCNCTVSPYKNFIDDAGNYNGITKDITDVNTNWGIRPIIDNVVISNELADNYVGSSAMQEALLPNSIPDYYFTTSTHLPVTAVFQFEVLGANEFQQAAWTVYPNPVKNELNISSTGTLEVTQTTIYDLTGRQVFTGRLSGEVINVSALPAGIYILKLDGRSARFVKE